MARLLSWLTCLLMAAHPLLPPPAHAQSFSFPWTKVTALSPGVGILLAEQFATKAQYAYLQHCRPFFEATADSAWQVHEGLQQITDDWTAPTLPLKLPATVNQKTPAKNNALTPLQLAAQKCRPHYETYVQQEALLQQQIESWWTSLDSKAIHKKRNYRDPIELTIHEFARALRKVMQEPGHTDIGELNDQSQCIGDIVLDQLFTRYLLSAFKIPGAAETDYVAMLTALQRHLGCLSPTQSVRLDLALRAATEFADQTLTKRGFPQVRERFFSALLNSFVLVADANSPLGATWTYQWLRTHLTPSLLHQQNSLLPGGRLGLFSRQSGGLEFVSTCDDSGVFTKLLDTAPLLPSAQQPVGGVAQKLSQQFGGGSGSTTTSTPSASRGPLTGFGASIEQAAEENCPFVEPAWRNNHGACRYPLSALQFVLDPVHQGHGACSYLDMLKGDGKCKLYLCGDRLMELQGMMGGEGEMADFSAGQPVASSDNSACAFQGPVGTFECLDQPAGSGEGGDPTPYARHDIGTKPHGSSSEIASTMDAHGDAVGNWSDGCNTQWAGAPIDVGNTETKSDGKGTEDDAKESAKKDGKENGGDDGEDNDQEDGDTNSGNDDTADGGTKGDHSPDAGKKAAKEGDKGRPSSASGGSTGTLPHETGHGDNTQNMGENLAQQAGQQPGMGSYGGHRGGPPSASGGRGSAGGGGSGDDDDSGGGDGPGSSGSAQSGSGGPPPASGQGGGSGPGRPQPTSARAESGTEVEEDLNELLRKAMQLQQEVEDPKTGEPNPQHLKYNEWKTAVAKIAEHPRMWKAYKAGIKNTRKAVESLPVQTAISAALSILRPDFPQEGLEDGIKMALATLKSAVAVSDSGKYLGRYRGSTNEIKMNVRQMISLLLQEHLQRSTPLDDGFDRQMVNTYKALVTKVSFHEVVAHAIPGAMGADGSEAQEHDLLAIVLELMTGENLSQGVGDSNYIAGLVQYGIVDPFVHGKDSSHKLHDDNDSNDSANSPDYCDPNTETCGACNLMTQQALHFSQCLGFHGFAGLLFGSGVDGSQKGGFGLLPPGERKKAQECLGLEQGVRACPMQMCGPGETSVYADDTKGGSGGGSAGLCTCRSNDAANPKAIHGNPWNRSSSGCGVVDCPTGTILNPATCQCQPDGPGSGARGLPRARMR